MLKKVILLTIVLASILSVQVCKKKHLPVFMDYIKNPCRIVMIPENKSRELYFTLKFKNAGVFHNSSEKHGISPIVSKLLFRKIGNLSVAATKEKMQQLGIFHISVSGIGDDFTISFRVVGNKAEDAIKFLSNAFIMDFSESDLAWAKEYFPVPVNPENSSPREMLREKLYKNLYSGHLYGESPTGSSRAITGITLADLSEFFKNNFTKNNLKVYCSGKCTPVRAKKLLGKLLERLPETGEGSRVVPLASANLKSFEKILNNNIKDVSGITVGIRLDSLSPLEKAALFIVADSLFDKDEGVFAKITKDIPMNFSYSINIRKLSSVLVITVFVNETNADLYIKRLNDFLNQCDLSKLSNLNGSRQYFEALQKRGVFSLDSIITSLGLLSLPFSKCDFKIYKKLISKISDVRNRYIVCISSK